MNTQLNVDFRKLVLYEESWRKNYRGTLQWEPQLSLVGLLVCNPSVIILYTFIIPAADRVIRNVWSLGQCHSSRIASATKGHSSKPYLHFSLSTMMKSLSGSWTFVWRYSMSHGRCQYGLEYGLDNQGFGVWISSSGNWYFTSPKRPERILGTIHLPN
jgi:hypothetical protein